MILSNIVVIAACIGCRNQQPMTNPFLTPDRVPPPSTRVLAPGASQPYYPGDPIPGAQPPVATTVPGAITPTYTTPPPGATYPTGPTYTPAQAPPTTGYPGAVYPQQSAPLTTPPGGWYPPSSQSTPMPSTSFASAESTAPLDGQTIWPQLTPAPTPLAQAPQRLQAREIVPAEYLAPIDTTPPRASATTDGFRPQSGEATRSSESSPSFRPPEIRRADLTGPTAGPADRFGVDSNYRALRGQLEYWPASGEWSLRYLPEGAADSLGGRVMIDNPQVFANLQPGEFVAVEGQLYSRASDAGLPVPAYRVSVVQRQRQ